MHDPQDDERAMTPHGATLRGAWSFALVSLAGFSIWAFAGRWFYRNVGEAGLYVAIAAVFLGMTVTRDGQPNVLATVAGVVTLGVMDNGLTQLQVDSYVRQVLVGAIILVAVSISALGRRALRRH